MNPVTLYVDGMCMMHRAAAGFTAGDHFVAFNFFRSLKSLVERFKPTRVVIALEGSTALRKSVDPAYKSNRVTRNDSFYSQVAETVQLLSEHFPVSVVRHPELEADDVIARLVRCSSTAIKSVIVSTDRDYLQLVCESPSSVELYDPVQKDVVMTPMGVRSFLVWRAIKGDASDCVPRIGSDEEACEASVDDGAFLALMAESPEKLDRFEKNVSLLQFADPADGEEGWTRMTSTAARRDWGAVALQFSMWEFRSILKDMAKFIAPFEALWAGSPQETREASEATNE